MKKLLKKIIYNKKTKTLLLNKFIKLHNYCYKRISGLVVELNDGIHPKHSIMKYHDFFINNMDSEETILDIGCGNGFLGYDISKKAKKVIGIDFNKDKIKFAQKKYKNDNLKFVIGDATQYKFNKKFDKIVLSNVLEHITDRVDLLTKISKISDTILLRVPMIDRDWLAVYKKENNHEYKLDPTHKIEYTIETLKNEIDSGGWRIEKHSIQFGEFWGILIRK